MGLVLTLVRTNPPSVAQSPCTGNPSRPGCLTIEVVVGKTPTGGRLRPATEFFALSLTREDHFRTVFRYSPPNTPRKYDGYKGKPQWHRCCLAPQQDRGSTFRLS